MGRLAAAVAAALLVATAFVHLYWAGGGRWPGTDEASLARRVVGETVRFPSPGLTAAVALALVVAAVLVLARGGVLPLPLPRRVVAIGVGAVVAVLALRGLAGGVTSGVVVSRGTQTPYFLLDLVVYSPLCLLLAGLSAAALTLTRQTAHPMS